MFLRSLRWRAAACVALFGVVMVAIQAVVLVDLRTFEYVPLGQMVGGRGLALAIALNLGIALLVSSSVALLRGKRRPFPWTTGAAIAVFAILILWLMEWVLLEIPLTRRIELISQGPVQIAQPREVAADLSNFSIMRRVTDAASREKFRVLYERIRVNSPDVFLQHPIGVTIDGHAARLDVDPRLLFFFLYVGSYWGEATSGPVPFAGSMTAETVRDVVQVHLPSWFIESRLRQYLISSELLERTFGGTIGFKLRYALHKATLDVSTQPYDLNLYSDVFLVLTEYPEHFADVLHNETASPLVFALRESFLGLRGSALVAPYEVAYARNGYEPEYFDAYREDLKAFARAAFYLTARDFDFATRVAALVIRYQRDFYRRRLGSDLWASLPDWQRAVMLGMTRDLYVPNVGRLGYNLYALPELNCVPVAFVAASAIAEPESIRPAQAVAWRPSDYLALWAGAATKLRVLSELWGITTGTTIPGLPPTQTVDAARGIVGINRRNPN